MPRVRKGILTEVQISAAIAMFNSGGGTMKSIAKANGVDPRTLRRAFIKRGVGVEPDPETLKEVQAAAAEEARRALMGGSALEHAKKVYETKERTRIAAKFAQDLAIMTIQRDQKEGRKIELNLNFMKTMSLLTVVLKNTQAIQYEALGIGTEVDPDSDVLPDLVIRVMDDKQVKQIREATRVIGNDLGIAEMPDITLDMDTDEENAVVEGQEDEKDA